ncbi:hypothetical protein QWY22_03785 [Planococcus liqunii]|uniref:hypothetical protein n=1 Tax=Planococcus liqunii TaxID=3058394 RepID=UPI002630FE12|nr:hypothetical protein [Planococcus sp. N056]WKA51733.1 hypothetical protein QWY22_03785 [Planococcus sp. N056]
MTDYRQKNRDSIRAMPKYDVCVAFKEADWAIAQDLFRVFDEHGITYSTYEDEKIAEAEAMRMIYPKMARDSYFFLLIDEPGSIDDDAVQTMLHKAMLANREPIVLKRQSGTSYPGIGWTADTKEAVFQEVAGYIRTQERDPDWIYGDRRK